MLVIFIIFFIFGGDWKGSGMGKIRKMIGRTSQRTCDAPPYARSARSISSPSQVRQGTRLDKEDEVDEEVEGCRAVER